MNACLERGRGVRPRQAWRFSLIGNPTIERLYRTHWVSPKLSEKKRERLVEKASRAPDLVVIQSNRWIVSTKGKACSSNRMRLARRGVRSMRRSATTRNSRKPSHKGKNSARAGDRSGSRRSGTVNPYTLSWSSFERPDRRASSRRKPASPRRIT